MYIYYFFISIYMGITVATAPMVSYNAGAGNAQNPGDHPYNHHRIRRNC